MGDMANAMLEGDLCASCGCVLQCDGFGVPIMCHSCHSDEAKQCSDPVDGALCERYYK